MSMTSSEVARVPSFSIVVPTYRRDSLLVSSLRLHAAEAVAHGGELIVVVNGRADELAAEIASVLDQRQVRILQVPFNAGFGGGCRVGAAASRAPLVIFSNDDFLPSPGWAAALVRRAAQIGRECIVGTTVVGFDGRVLDGAGIIDDELNIRPRDRGRPFGSVMRGPAADVDFVTGCGLAISRTLFDRLGGFDPLFDPAYFEDLDLCLRARELGAPIVLEPTAWGLHREGLSGVESRSELFENSRVKFLRRWRQRPFPPRNPASDHLAWRVLIIDDRLPMSSAGSGFSRMFREVEHFANDPRFDVDVLAMLHQESFSGASTSIDGVACVSIDDAIELADAGAYSVVLVSRPHNIERARRVLRAARSGGAKIVYDAEALFHRRIEVLAGQGLASKSELANAIRLDRRAIEQADAVVALNQVEVDVIRSWKSDGTVALSLPSSSQRSPIAASGSFRPRAVMLASWLDGEQSPNVEAVRWVAENVVPQVRSARADYRLDVTGTNPPSSIQSLAEVSLVGTRSLDELFAFGAVSVCANRLQAGVSMKLLDSVCLGVPVVAVPEAIASLPLSVRSMIPSAASAEELARLLIELSDEDSWRACATKVLEARNELLRLQRPVAEIVAGWLDEWGVTRAGSERLVACNEPGGSPIIEHVQLDDPALSPVGPELEAGATAVQELRLRLMATESQLRMMEASEIWRATAPVRRAADLLKQRLPRLDAHLRGSSLADRVRRRRS